MDEASALSNPVVEAPGMADAGAMAKNDAKIAGARYFIIFMLLPDVVSREISIKGEVDNKSVRFPIYDIALVPRATEGRPRTRSTQADQLNGKLRPTGLICNF